MSTDTSDPAFPLPLGEQNIHPCVSGLTKRERFAGMALANLYTHHESDSRKAAEWAYLLADAMIEEGKK